MFLVRLDPDTTLLCHDVTELDRVEFGRQRVVLIGDAAHAMTPNLGQGAAQALEDVPALVAALRAGPDQDLAGRVAALRTGRVGAVKNGSATMGRVGQASTRFTAALRDVVVGATPGALARRAARAVTDHDPVAAAEGPPAITPPPGRSE